VHLPLARNVRPLLLRSPQKTIRLQARCHLINHYCRYRWIYHGLNSWPISSRDLLALCDLLHSRTRVLPLLHPFFFFFFFFAVLGADLDRCCCLLHYCHYCCRCCCCHCCHCCYCYSRCSFDHRCCYRLRRRHHFCDHSCCCSWSCCSCGWPLADPSTARTTLQQRPREPRLRSEVRWHGLLLL